MNPLQGKDSGAIVKWADEAMFASEAHEGVNEGPKVYLLGAPTDPLGHIAACAKMYVGEVVRDLSDVTDEERRHYLAEMQKTKLKMPLEAVSLHFMLENVTRGFTHQLVRQRTAAYAQESMRFAVVEDMTKAVALPPSLAKYNDPQIAMESLARKDSTKEATSWPAGQFGPRDEAERQFWVWYETVEFMGAAYGNLVANGMPAEDARGLMPTSITTRVNYITNFRNFLDQSGNRLCTQAQFEWRLVFAAMAKAMRLFGSRNSYAHRESGEIVFSGSEWQWNAMADLLRPVCYQTGSCGFGAEFDRKCSIRGRVQQNAAMGRPSSLWHLDNEEHAGGEVQAINPMEWLANPAAAR